jgi:spermidine synthase
LFSDQISLKLLVFWSGAVLMGLEIAGSRVLAPHFGNSVFVWGSLISIFLIALSLGYYIGGRIADRYPLRFLLNSICIAVSLLIFGIAIFSRAFCEYLVEEGWGEQSGPFVASLVLFLPPSVGMGIVSPFAIRLATPSVTSVGKISGTLYALSTLGSIAGTVVTTFVLVPLIGLSAILKGLGLVLLATSLLTLPLRKHGQTVAGLTGLSLVTAACVLWPSPRLSLRRGESVVLDVDTPYHHISVVDNRLHESRELRFDRYVESAITTRPPYPTLSGYTNYFHLAFLAQPRIERSLFIGAGGGVGPRSFHMHDPTMLIDVVDIDPKVLQVAREHFYLENDDNISTIAQDGRMFVRTTEHEYDCVILDAFTIGGRIPFHLVTRQFFQLCHDRMSDDGVFVMNINSAIQGPLAHIFLSMYHTLQSVFPHTYAFVLGQGGSQYASTNVILVSSKGGEVSPQQWRDRARRYQSRSYIEPPMIQRMVEDLLTDVPDVSRAPVFTDDYAPIETMAF